MKTPNLKPTLDMRSGK